MNLTKVGGNFTAGFPVAISPSLGMMPQFGSEPKFEPELFRTGPRFGPRFSESTEPHHKSGSTFGQGRYFENRC